MSVLRGLRYRFDRWRATRSAAAPYRFLVRRWDTVRDFDLLVAAAGLDWYREHVALQELPLDAYSRVAVVAPHQDDETIGAGGTMRRMRDAGADVTIVLVTDGAQRWDDASDAEVVARRDAELDAVAADLGADVVRIGVSNVDPRPTSSDVERIAGALRERDVQLVLAPWVLDRPAKHRMVDHLLHLALRRPGVAVREVWGYQVHGDLFANGFVDITPVADAKRALLAHYASQTSRYKPFGHIAMGAAAWNARLVPQVTRHGEEPLFEVFNALPVEEFGAAVESLYLSDLRRAYGDEELARRMGALS